MQCAGEVVVRHAMVSGSNRVSGTRDSVSRGGSPLEVRRALSASNALEYRQPSLQASSLKPSLEDLPGLEDLPSLETGAAARSPEP